MPTIKNKTNQLLCFTSHDGDCAAIPPNQSLSVTEDLWADNKDQPNVMAMLDERQIFIVQDEPNAKAAKVTPSANPSSSGDDTSGGWASMHWRTAEKLIAEETNTETLGNLLENETRPKFIKMLAHRIEELEA